MRQRVERLVQVARRPYSAGNRARLAPYDSESLDFFSFWMEI